MTASPFAPASAGLRSLASRILDPASTGIALEQACAALYEWALAAQPELSGTATALASGLAIAPADAARCLLDAPRTACLARALDAAIAARLAQAPGARIDILYAGCGPLAPLALIAAARRDSTPLRIVLLDAHEQSLRVASDLFARAGLAGLLGAAVCADAARWQLPLAAPRPAILLAEVMQRALAREPQLAVVGNLLPQCAADCDLVPARIVIELALAPIESLFAAVPARPLHRVGRLLELSAATLPALRRALDDDSARLPPVALRIGTDAPAGCHAVLATRIDGGHGHVLAPGASGLTQPLPLLELGQVTPGQILRLRYRLAPNPGFEIARTTA